MLHVTGTSSTSTSTSMVVLLVVQIIRKSTTSFQTIRCTLFVNVCKYIMYNEQVVVVINQKKRNQPFIRWRFLRLICLHLWLSLGDPQNTETSYSNTLNTAMCDVFVLFIFASCRSGSGSIHWIDIRKGYEIS